MAVAIAVAAVTLGEAQSRGAQEGALGGLRGALADHNLVFEPATSADRALAELSDDEAAAIALDESGAPEKAEHAVYLGRFTDLDQVAPLPPDVPGPDVYPAPDAPNDQLVYMVQITGLELYPFGAFQRDGPRSPPPERAHHEEIVFVDALTGEEIMATTFR
jgi:hypothetical protein